MIGFCVRCEKYVNIQGATRSKTKRGLALAKGFTQTCKVWHKYMQVRKEGALAGSQQALRLQPSLVHSLEFCSDACALVVSLSSLLLLTTLPNAPHNPY